MNINEFYKVKELLQENEKYKSCIRILKDKTSKVSIKKYQKNFCDVRGDWFDILELDNNLKELIAEKLEQEINKINKQIKELGVTIDE